MTAINMIPKALQVAWDAIDGANSDKLHAAKAKALLHGYHYRWCNEGWKTIETEQEIVSPIPRLTSKGVRFYKNMLFGGKVDLIAERAGRRTLMDHKTTSQDVSDPASSYWRQLQLDVQVLHYLLALWVAGWKVDDVVWDVIRKPTIKPKKLTKSDRQAIVVSGKYCGCEVSEDALRCVQESDSETLELYEFRLRRDCTRIRPDYYFMRRSVPVRDDEILAYAKELWKHRESIIRNAADSQPVRNSGACLQYGAPCKFLGICSGYDSPDSTNWRRKPQVHGELKTIEGDGRNLITPSRIKTHQTCLTKEKLYYVDGLERIGRDEDALVFGHLVHEALEAWWNAFRE